MDGTGLCSFNETHSSFSQSERTYGVREVFFYNLGSAVVKTIMGKGPFKLLAKNRVSFSSTFWILMAGGTVKIRNGLRVWKVSTQGSSEDAFLWNAVNIESACCTDEHSTGNGPHTHMQ